jgi:hypothetical protein
MSIDIPNVVSDQVIVLTRVLLAVSIPLFILSLIALIVRLVVSTQRYGKIGWDAVAAIFGMVIYPP